MLLIVAHHYVVNSGLLQVMSNNPVSGRAIYLYLFGMWGKTGINCFVLITGYFMCKSEITIRKFLKLILEVEFYNVVIYLVFLLSGYESFSVKSFIKAIIPVYDISSDFTSCFLMFYLFIPFLNILIRNMNKPMHKRLVILCLILYTFFGTAPKCHVVMNYVSWFCVLYFISSYIRIYGFIPKVTNRQWGEITLLSVVLSIASVLMLIELHQIIGIKLVPYRLVSDSNVFFAIFTAVCSFMYFKDLKIRQSRLINTISASTFGVLCIHANSDTMRQWLWKDMLNNVGQYQSDNIYWISILSVMMVFIICILIDHLRIISIEKWTLNFLDRKLGRITCK
ncbi:hypothetical protein LPYR103PRE_24840 [Segatella asaccharophila]|jgi:hypothetical protein|nr:acyltransferase [Prevotella sp.]